MCNLNFRHSGIPAFRHSGIPAFRHYNVRPLWVPVITLVFVVFSVLSTATAGITGCVEGDSSSSLEVRAIVTPEVFNLMPVGSLVSERMVWRKGVKCFAEAPLEWVGSRVITAVGMKVVNGVSLVKTGYRGVPLSGFNAIFDSPKIYTTPELEALGIGIVLSDQPSPGRNEFVYSVNTVCGSSFGLIAGYSSALISNPITMPQPIFWSRPRWGDINYSHHGYCQSIYGYSLPLSDVVFRSYLKIEINKKHL